MDSLRAKWNSRYANGAAPDVDNDLAKHIELFPKGFALDIACGMGQNAKFLAQKGFHVDALDISDKALATLQDVTKIDTFCMDVHDFPWSKERYQLILNVNFLDRSIFSHIIDALAPGGYLFFKTFTYKSSMNRKYVLRKNELVQAFDALEIEYYRLIEEGKRALLIAKKTPA